MTVLAANYHKESINELKLRALAKFIGETYGFDYDWADVCRQIAAREKFFPVAATIIDYLPEPDYQAEAEEFVSAGLHFMHGHKDLEWFHQDNYDLWVYITGLTKEQFLEKKNWQGDEVEKWTYRAAEFFSKHKIMERKQVIEKELDKRGAKAVMEKIDAAGAPSGQKDPWWLK